jgi:pyruvate-ferredoxin/flavodoxin oxidoreductase
MVAAAAAAKDTPAPPVAELVRRELEKRAEVTAQTKTQFLGILEQLPLAYAKVTAIFAGPERKAAGSGGIFGIFVSDLCKGCGECVHGVRRPTKHSRCRGDRSRERAPRHGTAFLDCSATRRRSNLGLYVDQDAAHSREAALRNHLDGAPQLRSARVGREAPAPGCGEKSVLLLRLASTTEALLRPAFHRAKNERPAPRRPAQLQQHGESRGCAARRQRGGP